MDLDTALHTALVDDDIKKHCHVNSMVYIILSPVLNKKLKSKRHIIENRLSKKYWKSDRSLRNPLLRSTKPWRMQCVQITGPEECFVFMVQTEVADGRDE